MMGVVDNLTLEKAQEALNKVRDKYEGDGERLAIITPERYDETVEIMKNHFVPDEPLCQSFGVVFEKNFENMVRHKLSRNVSVCMISCDTNEIMGIRTVDVMKITDPPEDVSSINYTPLRELFTFVFHKNKEIDFFNRFGIEEAIHFFTLGVRTKYRQRGLGSRLLAAAVDMSRELGFSVVKGEGTSNFSKIIYEKMGFETLVTLPYDDYKMLSGETISQRSGIHKSTKVYALRL